MQETYEICDSLIWKYEGEFDLNLFKDEVLHVSIPDVPVMLRILFDLISRNQSRSMSRIFLHQLARDEIDLIMYLVLCDDWDWRRWKFNSTNLDEQFPVLFHLSNLGKFEIKCFFFKIVKILHYTSIFDLYFNL
jgi:hypothetical protein